VYGQLVRWPIFSPLLRPLLPSHRDSLVPVPRILLPSSNTRGNRKGTKKDRAFVSGMCRDQRRRETTKIATGWLARKRGYGVRVRLPWSSKIYATGGEIRLSPDRPERLWSHLVSLFSQEATYWIVHVNGSRRFSLRRSSYPRGEAIDETIYAPTVFEMSPQNRLVWLSYRRFWIQVQGGSEKELSSESFSLSL